MTTTYNLDCKFDTRASFYGKAQVKEETHTGEYGTTRSLNLYSYNTLVAKIFYSIDDTVEYICFGKYSQTTTRHQKEFFKQNGLNDKEIKEVFKNGILTKGDWRKWKIIIILYT